MDIDRYIEVRRACDHRWHRYKSTFGEENLWTHKVGIAGLKRSPSHLENIHHIWKRNSDAISLLQSNGTGTSNPDFFDLLVFDSFCPNIMDFPSIFDKFWNQEEIKGSHVPTVPPPVNIIFSSYFNPFTQQEIHPHALQNRDTYPS